MTRVQITRTDTPLGTLEAAVVDGALCEVRFDDRWGSGKDVVARRFSDADVVAAEDPGGVTSALRRYFDGDVHAIDDLPVDVAGTPFQEAVWKALRTVGAGETITYGDLARHVGNPKAVRAVGTAVGSNPVGVVLPCHRIVPASGGIGNYGGGVDRKRWLLEHEGATVL